MESLLALLKQCFKYIYDGSWLAIYFSAAWPGVGLGIFSHCFDTLVAFIFGHIVLVIAGIELLVISSLYQPLLKGE